MLFRTAFWQFVVSYPLETAIFCCLSKALLKALFPREHLHICKKRERGPQELCAGYFKIILIYYPVTLEWLLLHTLVACTECTWLLVLFLHKGNCLLNDFSFCLEFYVFSV